MEGWTRVARSLSRVPAFTVPALLVLAVGMTAATTIFTVADAIVFRPLDLPDSGRLVMVCEDHPRLRGRCLGSPGNIEDFRRHARSLSDLGMGRTWPYTLITDTGTEGVNGGLASAGFLRSLGARPVVGRLFRDDEFGDHDKVVVLSHDFWTARFGADPSIVGAALRMDGHTYEIVGVLQEGFEVPLKMASVPFWKPLHFDPLDPEERGWRGFRAVGRLAPGATREWAADELRAIYASLAEAYPDDVNDEWHLRVTGMLDVVVEDTRPVLLAFLGAAALLLLIVCANVANLLLARGLGRRRELAVRAALGAQRGRLVWGILGESLVLTGLGAVIALLLAQGATVLLLRLAPPMPRMDEVAVDGRVLAFTVLLSVVATAVFAVLPALRVTAWDLAHTIRSGAREGEPPGSSRLRSAFVVAELALSLVLLGGAGVLARSFCQYLAWDPGFDRTTLLAVHAFVNTGKYATREQGIALWRRAEERVAAVPGVVSVATASAGPLFGGGDGALPYVVEGADGSVQELPAVWWYDVGPGYFRTLGLPLLEGREIADADGPEVEPTAVVNRTLARNAWPGESAVGRTIYIPEFGRSFRVVGVVADAQPLTPGEAPLPEIYWSNRQLGRPATYFLVRTSGAPADLSSAVEDALLAVDPDLSLSTPRPLVATEERLLVRPRFQALVILVFALAALALSAVGVYAVVSYSVTRRVREIGIRIAVGAGSAEVLWLVLRSSMTVAFAGIGLGLGASLGVAQLTRRTIHGVSPTDPLSLGVAVLVLAATAAVAAYVPARRATRTDPVRAIRSD